MDVEGGIGAGQDFVRVLEEQVLRRDAGADWPRLADRDSEAGRPRLENPEDFVRGEVAQALGGRDGKKIRTFPGHTNDLPEVPSSHLAQREDWRRVTVARSVVECEMGDFG